MTSALDTFFEAWAIEDQATRDAQIDTTLGETISYADPRTEAAIETADDVKTYVGMFSQMAPGMPVSVVHTSTTLNYARVAVLFGAGEKSQLGQYTATLDSAGKITHIVGFVGLGTPE